MANWASTSYAIEGPEEILKKIEQAILHHDTAEGSSNNWEGNILNALDIKWLGRDEDLHNGKYLRGFIREDVEPWYDDETGALRFDAEEAWGVTDFYECLETEFPAIKVYWVTEEPGMAVYETNDAAGKYFADRCYVDTCIKDNYQADYFTKEEDAYRWLSKLTEGKVNNQQDVEAFNNTENNDYPDDYIEVFKYRIVED